MTKDRTPDKQARSPGPAGHFAAEPVASRTLLPMLIWGLVMIIAGMVAVMLFAT